jgi:hypothetical protein
VIATLGPIAEKRARRKAALLGHGGGTGELPLGEDDNDDAAHQASEAQRQSAWREFVTDKMSESTLAAYRALYPHLYCGPVEGALADVVEKLGGDD